MQTWKRILLFSVIGILILSILLSVLALIYTDFVVDMWWYDSLGYGLYFWQRLLYSYVVFILATLLLFFFFYLNFRIASRYLSTTSSSEAKSDSKTKELLKHLREGSAKVYLPISIILAVIIAYPLYTQWEATLLYVFAPAAGIADPAYGKDISYYLFSLPIYLLVLTEVFIALFVLLISLLILYYLEGKTLAEQNRVFPHGAKKHLSTIVAMIFLVGVGDLVLQRHQLLYVENHLPLFYGPGYVEMNVILPLIWASIIFLVGLAFTTVYFINTQKGLKILVAFAGLFVVALSLRYWPGIPEAVQDYIVEPDELSREETYMVNNIQATLAAYDLLDVETRDYEIEIIPEDLTKPEIQAGIRNIPIWDREVLLEVYKQLQEIRTYYEFLSVDVDRYTIEGVYQQVFLSPRELNFESLPEDSKTWVNRWLKYTHGYGAVMSPAAQVGEQPKEWFLQDIPPESDYDISIEEPGLYFGMQALNPVIAPNELGEIAYPENDEVVLEDYRGKAGIGIYNLFPRAVFSLYFRDYRIFFSTALREDSRILIRRNIHDTIGALTPFFILDKDPYIVVTPERIYWIQDAYIYSSRYPYAQSYEHAYIYYDGHIHSPVETKLNYVRNSVKIVVDAYNGTIDYYIAEPDDPIIQAYSRIYPGLLKDLDQIPETLKPHIRYPKDIFDIQMNIYAKYHQTEPSVFYGQEDRWVFPKIEREGIRTVTPYFVTLNLIDRDKLEHILLIPMNPEDKENLRALAVAGSDRENYGRIIVYSFPKGELVHGLSQVEALINQDTTIAEQFTLWSQAGSEVELGKIILIPVGGEITYIQPVYLKAAEEVRIPELKRVIVSQGEFVAMEPSLEEAFEALRRKVTAENQR